jgi:hypothetical protein
MRKGIVSSSWDDTKHPMSIIPLGMKGQCTIGKGETVIPLQTGKEIHVKQGDTVLIRGALEFFLVFRL